MRRRAVAVSTALATVAALAGAGPAHASFPGANGPIAYVNSGQIFLLDPTISPPVTQQITKAGSFQSVNFDATGRKLVADTNAAGLDGVVFLEPKPESTITRWREATQPTVPRRLTQPGPGSPSATAATSSSRTSMEAVAPT